VFDNVGDARDCEPRALGAESTVCGLLSELMWSVAGVAIPLSLSGVEERGRTWPTRPRRRPRRRRQRKSPNARARSSAPRVPPTAPPITAALVPFLLPGDEPLEVAEAASVEAVPVEEI
jgi:hypothetical protein